MGPQKNISKEAISLLPLYHYSGEIVVVQSRNRALEAIDWIQKEKILGFDTETRPSFKKGENFDISLLQLATETHAFLFRLNIIGFLPELAAILADKSIIKAGVAVRDDIKGLQKLLPFKEENFVELAEVARQKKLENFGLRGLVAICLQKRLSKKAKISNWDQKNLTPAQIEYAASDAWAGFQIYHRLNSF